MLTWKAIPTRHFRVYFHQGEEEWARKTARIAEEVHSTLAPKLGWEPAEPTQIVLADNEDSVSGSATPFPNNTIYIGLAPPLASALPFLERYEDWIRDVITHEYTHILQLDMNTGFPSLMRMIFGRQPIPFLIFNSAIPNILQPDWLIEGLATYEETATGVSDRRDSAYAEMVLRMAILENRFPTLDQAGGRDTWPDHQIEYIFGARFYDYLARRFGESVLKDLSLGYSERVIPFFVGTNGRQVLGQTYDGLWENWKTELTTKYQQQRNELEAMGGTTASQPLTRQGDYVLGPRTNPKDRRVAYTRVNPHAHPSIHLIDPETGQDWFLIDRNYGFTASWSYDGRRMAFSQLEVHRNNSVYSDLYLYDLSSKKLRRLTKGARLRDPDFHPDGNRLICVENRLGKNRLVVFDLPTGRSEVLDWAGEDLMLFHPRWSPDGKSVAVGTWKNSAQGIGLLDLDRKAIAPIRTEPALDLTPTWSPDGSYLLFSSDRTGVYNLFAYSVNTSELFQVTNVLGGAFTPEITPDGREIHFSGYTSRGFDLQRMAWDPTTWKKVEVRVHAPQPVSETQTVSPDAKAEPYSPWPTLRPHFWTPIFGADESGSQIGAATGGMDVLGRHKFNAVALYGASAHRAAYSLQYVNDSFYPSFHIGVSDLAVPHSDFFKNADTKTDYWERQQRLDLDTTLSRIAFLTQQSVTLGYRAERLSGLTDIPAGFVHPDEGILSGFRLAWRLNTAREYGFSISLEDGRRLLARYERFDRRLGSDSDQDRYIVSWHEYQGLFWPHHVLAARLTGALSTGDRLLQRAFELGGPSLTEEFINPEQTDFSLRGYPARLLRGHKAALGTLEYRFPIQNIERGVSTWPFFFRRTHAAVFFDIGNAWDKETTLSDFRRGVGAEVAMDMILGHLLPVRFRLGFARGLDEDGENQTYFTIGNSF